MNAPTVIATLRQTGRWSWTASIPQVGSIIENRQEIPLMLDPLELHAFGWRARERALRKARRWHDTQRRHEATHDRYRAEATEVEL